MTKIPDSREQLIDQFIASCDIDVEQTKPLAQDASFRRYFRVYTKTQSFILMDAPPEHEAVMPYISVAKHLQSLNLRAPSIHQVDSDNGFILLEDFGDNTFTSLLRDQHEEDRLYQAALACLIHLHQHPRAASIQLPNYGAEQFIREALLLCDWYYPTIADSPIGKSARHDYETLWQAIFSALPQPDKTLVLRDFHVDNLIRLDTGDCGLLDFQDALIGPSAYDLVSLLEDARRDVNPRLQAALKAQYFNITDTDQHAFMRWYHVLGAQRHCKVLGIFTRLSVRDKKHAYLQHLPRVKRLLKSHLNHTDLLPLKNWLSTTSVLD